MNPPVTAPSPLVALLQRLAHTAVGSAGVAVGGGKVRVEAVEPRADGAELVVRVGAAGGLLDAPLRVRLTITAVEADCTRCTLSLPQSRGLSRLLGGALERLPTKLVQPVLERLFGDAVTLDGETLLLHHRRLVQHLAGRRS